MCVSTVNKDLQVNQTKIHPENTSNNGNELSGLIGVLNIEKDLLKKVETPLEILIASLKKEKPDKPSKTPDEPISFMSFNARDERADNNEKNHPERAWDNPSLDHKDRRRHRFVDEILDHHPDFVGVQELSTATQRGYVEDKLQSKGGYDEVKVGNCADNGLFYDASKFSVATDTKGEVKGKIDLGGGVYVVWAKFVDKQTGKTVMISSTHFPPGRTGWKLPQDTFKQEFQQAMDRCGKDTPVVLAGDYSASPLSLQMDKCFQDLGLKSTYRSEVPYEGPVDKQGIPITLHGEKWTDDKDEPWNPKDDLGAHLDDGEFDSGNIICTKNETFVDRAKQFDQYHRGPAYASDHFAVESEYLI